RGGQPQIAARPSVLRAPDLGIFAEIADQDHLVHATGHDALLLVACIVRGPLIPSPGPSRRLRLRHHAFPQQAAPRTAPAQCSLFVLASTPGQCNRFDGRFCLPFAAAIGPPPSLKPLGNAAAPISEVTTPHGIIGFVHLGKRDLRRARSGIRRVAAASVEACGVVHSSTTAVPPRLSGLAKRRRSYYVPSGVPRAEPRRDASLASSICPPWPSHMIAPTDRMNDLFDQGRPRREASADCARVMPLRGAREHNLKDIDLEIPRDQLVVFTGLSGSGKSSLAFDTIYAE